MAENTLLPYGEESVSICQCILKLGMAVDEGWIYPPEKRIARIEMVARYLGEIKEELEESQETDEYKWIIRYPASSIRRVMLEGIGLIKSAYEL